MTGRLKNVLLVGLVVVMINLPFVHSTWQQHRIDQRRRRRRRDGHRPRPGDGQRLVTFEVADSDDQPGFGGSATVDEATYDDAWPPGRCRCGCSRARRRSGGSRAQTRSNLGLVITVVADVFLLVLVLLLLRFGSRLRQEMVLVATEDLERCPPGSVLDQVDGLRFVVCGEVEIDRGRRGGSRPRRPPGPGRPGRPPQPRGLPAAGPGNWDDAGLRDAETVYPSAS